MKSDSGTIMIAGGGTAGHVLPGMAIAQELIDRGRGPDEFVWVGSARGQEASLVPPSGIPLVLLPGRGIQRKLSLQNVRSVFELLGAIVQGIALVRRRRPSVVLTLGGYASVAAALGAVLWRVPLVVAEQNASAGAANKLVGRFARACAVPVAGTDLPRAVVTGNPVRQQILDAAGDARDRAGSQASLGLPAGRIVVSAFAGSLGSRRINVAVAELVEHWAHRSDVAVHHVVGDRDWDTFEAPKVEPGGIFYQAVRYEQRMELVLAGSDLAVCRSGGTTVAELGVIGVGSVLVPLPIAPRDHQRANAAELVEVGAALLVDDEQCTGDHLESLLTPLLDDPVKLQAMSVAAASVGHPDAAQRVADLVEESAK